MASHTRGTLHLIPTPLDHGCENTAPLNAVLPEATIVQAAALSHWICENAKSTRAFLKRVQAHTPLGQALQEQRIVELPRHVHKQGDHTPGQFDARPLLQAALDGHDVGLVSEAGMPAVADPGSSVVAAAHRLGIAVQAHTGPASLILTLAASGLNGQNFAFVGYLPVASAEKAERLKTLAKLIQQSGQTQLWIETPYRNAATLQAVLESVSPGLRLCLASALTLPEECVQTRTVQEWRAAWRSQADALTTRLKHPTVFALGR